MWSSVWAVASGLGARSLQAMGCLTIAGLDGDQLERTLRAQRSACRYVVEAELPVLEKLEGGLAGHV